MNIKINTTSCKLNFCMVKKKNLEIAILLKIKILAL